MNFCNIFFYFENSRLVVSKTWFYLFQSAKLLPTGVRGHSLRTNYDIFVCPTPDLKYDRMFGWVWYYTSLEKSVWYYMYDTICGWQIFGKSGSMIQYVWCNIYYRMLHWICEAEYGQTWPLCALVLSHWQQFTRPHVQSSRNIYV